MPANTSPIFTLTPNLGSGGGATAANTKSDGSGTIGTDLFVVFTAGANGSYLARARFTPTATTAGTSTTATVARLFACSASSGATTTSNTRPLGELTLPSVTADSTSAGNFAYELPLGLALPANWTVLVSNHAAPAANTLWVVTFIGCGDY